MTNHNVVQAIIIGNAGVGKTSLLRKLTEGTFYNNSQTIGVDFFSVSAIVKNSHVKIRFWDTAGHDRYKYLVKTYFYNREICYVVFDVCEPESFASVPLWISMFKDNSTNINTILVILATKIDNKTKRKVSYEEGKKLADANNALYIEISSKASVNLDNVIIEPVSKLLDLYKEIAFQASYTRPTALVKNKNNKIGGCCSVQ